ncbi:MAG: hypothetical protein IJU23_08275 [Proteobacteria bacterium]|nr:hypothetical protein [Pseudomonadota bacterium]
MDFEQQTPNDEPQYNFQPDIPLNQWELPDKFSYQEAWDKHGGLVPRIAYKPNELIVCLYVVLVLFIIMAIFMICMSIPSSKHPDDNGIPSLEVYLSVFGIFMFFALIAMIRYYLTYKNVFIDVGKGELTVRHGMSRPFSFSKRIIRDAQTMVDVQKSVNRSKSGTTTNYFIYYVRGNESVFLIRVEALSDVHVCEAVFNALIHVEMQD